MKTHLPSRWHGLAALWALPCCLTADTPLPPATVLERQVVMIGDQKLILERITPPPTEAPQVPVPSSSIQTPAAPLSLGCTVHGGLFTEIRWQDAAGGQFAIWSSLNLMALSGGVRAHFDWLGTRYGLHLSLGQTEAAESAGQMSEFSQITPPAGDGPWYAIVQQPESAVATDYAGINALHLWFVQNQALLLAEQAAVKTANEAQAAARAAQPESKETIMRFWPLQSVLHGVQPTTTVNTSGEGQP